MCGRYANFMTTQKMLDEFFVAKSPELLAAWRASWNIAPTQVAPIVTNTQGRELTLARWGLVPSWAKDPSVGARMINARAETVADKPSFRSAFAERRCLVPASGYYEWQKVDGGKRPHFIHPPDDGVLAFAGLWEPGRKDTEGRPTYTIITRDASAELAEIHDRQPVMLGRDAYDAWLDMDASQAELEAVLSSASVTVEATEVGSAVGNVRNNGPELVAPL